MTRRCIRITRYRAAMSSMMIGNWLSMPNQRKAIRKLQAALCELVIEGVKHNAQLHVSLLGDARFKLRAVGLLM